MRSKSHNYIMFISLRMVLPFRFIWNFSECRDAQGPTFSKYTQNPGSSAYTHHWVLYTWDELIISSSQVGEPLHEFEEYLSRSSLIWTLNLLKLNFESAFPQYVWGVCVLVYSKKMEKGYIPVRRLGKCPLFWRIGEKRRIGVERRLGEGRRFFADFHPSYIPLYIPLA